jgi:hypothetical protein
MKNWSIVATEERTTGINEAGERRRARGHGNDLADHLHR